MTSDPYPMPKNRLYIAGEWRQGRGAEITSLFPADQSLNTTINGASRDDALEAIAAAMTAQAASGWADLLPHERARYLLRIADGLDANAARIAWIQSRDTGKTLGETRALAGSAAATFRYYAAACETREEALTPSRGGFLTFSLYEPLGVVAAITPWNSPIASDAQKIAPALAAGNAVLLKPASWSPLTCLELARVIDEAGLPKGLFSTLPGSGAEIGDLLVAHPDIDRVSFTGGTATGRNIAEKAARKLMPVSLELGGKSPTILFEDADQDLAIAGIVFGMFSSSGQSCIAGSRLFVPRVLWDSFVPRLVAATQALVTGHPHDPATQVAPLIHPNHRDHVAAMVDAARDEGATVLCGGKAPDDPALRAGNYYLPTILTDLPNTATICQQEVFGPVLVVLPYDDEADVIAQANDNDYGLACGLWSRDFNRCWRVARAIRAGTVWINTYKQFSISTPFGGDKASGTGREKGREGLLAYMRQKTLFHDMTDQPHPWARWPAQDEG
jgi:betaine-aldehyde dehydrogenase